jgi:NAD(P)-dependent dehydrogenase (short-subunit alcohol dehydrogenase family)
MKECVLIVGAGGGIGAAVTKRLATKYRVVLVDRIPSNQELLQTVGAVTCEIADVRELTGCQRIGNLAAAHNVRAVVNCAGVSYDGTIDIPDSDLVEQIDINLVGAIRVARAVVPHFMERGGGDIITIVSRSGLHARKNLGAYAASKFGFIGFSEALNLEFADFPLRSTCICPGVVNTPMSAEEAFPRDKLIQPDDIAACVELALRLSPKTVLLPILLEPKCQINSSVPAGANTDS